MISAIATHSQRIAMEQFQIKITDPLEPGTEAKRNNNRKINGHLNYMYNNSLN